jgi:pimeloyl-ACP methyl ester carboxylesterase
VVLVPGVGTDRGDAGRLGRDAEEVWRHLAGRAAVVSWLGYDPPDHVPLGVDRRPAHRGAPELVRQVAALRAAGARRVVVVGHSYGGLVATVASAEGMGADELVLLGAPGLGVADLAALHLPPGADLWAAAARLDPISWLARTGLVHGPDPADLALAMPTSLDGHSSYLADPVLLAALAEVVLAEPVPSAHRRARGQ